MQPGFSALFQRGSYSSLPRFEVPVTGNKDHSQDQRERFAGAMLALGLKLDPAFRKHFLRAVCECDDSAASGAWTILIEPANWGDLFLLDKIGSRLTVIELKIDASLKPHQDPSKG